MFLFLRLYLAHLIADFPLQTDKIYAYKVRSIKGIILHSGISAFMMMIFLWPFLNRYQSWLFILMIWITHAIQDQWKVLHSAKNSRGNHIFWYCFDQFLHLLFISILFLTPLKDWSSVAIDPPKYFSWYYNNNIILIGIGLILSTWTTTYLLQSIKTVLYNPQNKLIRYSFTDKYYGIFERGILFGLFLKNGIFLLLIPFILLLRLFYSNWQQKQHPEQTLNSYFFDFLIGIISVSLVYMLINYLFFLT